jgi:actin-related protein
MATYAMACQSACVVDIGSQKISVCCVDDGIIIPKTIFKRNYGGDDISELLLRLMQTKGSLHYFPKHVFYPLHYPYHMMLLEHIKEVNSSMQMNEQQKELVKIIKLWLKEQKVDSMCRTDRSRKLPNAIQLQFNCSDALILAP